MTIQEGYNYISEIYLHNQLLGISQYIPIAALLLTLILITRDVNKWKLISLPAIGILGIIGFQYSPVFYLVTAIFYVIEILSTPLFSRTITLATTTITQPYTDTLKAQRKVKYQITKENILNKLKPPASDQTLAIQQAKRDATYKVALKHFTEELIDKSKKISRTKPEYNNTIITPK